MVPLIVGTAVDVGPATAAMVDVGPLVAEVDPSALLAITFTRAVLPRSLLANL
jgi:hypothetical protein